MTALDSSLFLDIANAIGLQSPAFIEKDYYAIQLLKIISEIKLPEGKFIFAGGTCLTKAHLPTFRMSEDIDIKFLPAHDFHNHSESQKRKIRSNLGTSILKSIEKSSSFSTLNKESRSEGRYKCFTISYPKSYRHTSLRPELQLEFTESVIEYFPSITTSISSIYASVIKKDPEINTILCDHVSLIFVEKFVGLLRRIAEVYRGYSEKEDEALVRHIYDLHLIYNENKIDFTKIPKLVQKIITRDINQFGMRHKEFKANPYKELLYGLDLLLGQDKHRERYSAFLGPLVYNPNPPTWNQGIKSLENLSKILIPN